KSYAYDNEKPNTKKASLDFRPIASNDHYTLIEVDLHTGRHHQIRCQLAHIGLPIKGDLKYGAKRSNPDGSISLCAHTVDFIHPVTKAPIHIEAPLPADPIWRTFSIQA
ncbi:MAG: RNA pseudouridine synthase, partial [Bacteroidaceae bacterium]|nr:RNA pseudouridine synthase [Bacteroidaceae bacterium]